MDGGFDLRVAAREVRPRLPKLPELSNAAIATWRGRMVNEYSSSRVFDALALQMRGALLPQADIESCLAFAGEERKHGVLCGAVVEALGDEARGVLREEAPFPQHEETSPMVGVLRNVLSISCMSETIAVALIGAERLEMPEGELRNLLTEIWADEVGHARFGWSFVQKHVRELDDDERLDLEDYLPFAFRHLEEHELAHLADREAPGKGGEALGLCSGRDARALFYETVETVIVPRLEALGLRAEHSWRTRHVES